MDFSSFVLEEQRVQSTHKSSPASHSRSLLPPRSRRRTQTYRRHGGTAESRSDAGSAEKPLSGDGHCPQKGRPGAPRHLRAERRETLPPAARPHAAAGLLSGGRGPLRAPPPPPSAAALPTGEPTLGHPAYRKGSKGARPPRPEALRCRRRARQGQRRRAAPEENKEGAPHSPPPPPPPAPSTPAAAAPGSRQPGCGSSTAAPSCPLRSSGAGPEARA